MQLCPTSLSALLLLLLLLLLPTTSTQPFCAYTDALTPPACCPRDTPCNRGTSKPAFFNGRVYSHFRGTRLHWWETNAATGAINGAQVYSDASSPVQGAFLAGTPVVSANGTTNGVVWTAPGNVIPSRIYAHDAQTGKLLLSQSIAGQSWVKFTVPTIVNGQVYLGTQAGVAVLRLP
jgi:hypothetical protein